MFRSRALWLTLLAGSLLAGASALPRHWDRSALRLHDRDASLRAVGRDHLLIDDAPERLRAFLTDVPGDSAVIVFGRAPDWRLNETYLLISYLAWPRPVWLVCAGARAGSPIDQLPPPAGTKPGALMFFDSTLPAGLRAEPVQIGPKLAAVLRPSGS